MLPMPDKPASLLLRLILAIGLPGLCGCLLPDWEDRAQLDDLLRPLGYDGVVYDDGVACETGAVRVGGGPFQMGCNSELDYSCEDNEYPEHTVTVDGFCIDVTEVTKDAFGECVSAEACTPPSTSNNCHWGETGRGDHPINCVDWYQAEDFCTWVGGRLPTEAEWEKAARGPNALVYPWGSDSASCEYAVMWDGGSGCGEGDTWPVGSKPGGASPYGALDMAGNVNEWTADRYASDYYSGSPSENPTGPTSGPERVFRGGDYMDNPPGHLRTSRRYGDAGGDEHELRGFRCVR